MKKASPDEVLSVSQAAVYLGVDRAAIKAGIYGGTLTPWKRQPVLLLRADLERWKRRGRGRPHEGRKKTKAASQRRTPKEQP